VADDPWAPAAEDRSYDPAATDLAELRELILGAERRRLRELERRLDAASVTPAQLADLLPEAIARRARLDGQLARALAPTIEGAIGESVRRNPREIATAIFPVLGPAIRKAIAEALAGLVASINRTIEHSVSPRGIRWRIEAWRTGIPFAQIVLKHALVYRVEQVFLIHAETGLLLAHASAPDLPPGDGDLISGMLTAIRDFVADSFAPEREAGGLRRFCVGELTVMVEQGPRALMAAVVRGEAPDTLLARLQNALEAVHLQFARELAVFDGDAAPFAPARPRLAECLETVVATDPPDGRRGRAAWLPWVAVAALLVLAIAWLAVRAERRWTRAVAALESAPGIVLARAERGGGRWRFTGLRDPDAAAPAAILAAAGVDTEGVAQRWEPFVSLQPAMVLARARHRLAPPAGLRMTLAADTLRLHGSAPIDWLAATARLAALPAGVSALDPSGVTPETPPALARLRADVEGQRILFDVGSARLGRSARAGVGQAAGAYARLAAAAESLGVRTTLELIGRTDPTGSDATNQALSRLRAEAVLAELSARGVPAGGARVSGVGTARPLAAADSAGEARINRSVSFGVRLGVDARDREGSR
jgi:OOP family OmpA-OmpF porin